MTMWSNLVNRIYKYVFPLLPDEYVTFTKRIDEGQVLLEALPKHSTKDLGTIKEEDFKKMLMRGDLRLHKETGWHTEDVKRLKTGGCTCGAWVTQNKDAHARGCDLAGIYSLPRGTQDGF